MSAPFKILISGIGVTGPVLAYWLARANTASKPIHITMIDRASSLLESGQGIDIEGPAREIVKRMGLLETMKARTTSEQGFCCIDNNNKAFATFVGGGMTNEIEMMRGDMCQVLTDAVKDRPNVTIQYSRRITDVVQTDDKVQVTLSKGDGQSYREEYSAVIAADGIRSRTRDLMLDPADLKACVRPWDMFTAFFSIPTQPQDSPYSRFQHALRGRSVIIRPVTEAFSSVYLIAVGNHPLLAESLAKRDQKARRQSWADTFSDIQYGEFPRVLGAMQETDNFYFDQISQVKLPKWHKGRCAVVGDAAYAPSLITGQGVGLAMLGAYILAGELGTNLDDPVGAFLEYEKKLQVFVEKAQEIPLGGWAPYVFNPQTGWGIWALQMAFSIVAFTKITRWFPDHDTPFDLPDYKFV